MPKWLVMTRKKSPAELESLENPGSIEEIMESLKSVGAEVQKIAKLNSKEEVLITELLAALETVPQKMFSIRISTSELPFRTGAFTQANIDASGRLILTAENGNLIVKDLRETGNRDLMMAVVGDIVPKFKDLASQLAEEKIQKPPEVEEIIAPEPLEPTPAVDEVPVEVPEVEAASVQEEAPIELSRLEVEAVPEVPVLSADEKTQMEEITAETLQDLETLGNEVFTQSPVSVYFDDWLVHLRQVILALESRGIIKVDEEFTDECEQIYRDIEEELANRLLKEAELEASTKTLAEKRHILGEMDAEYAAKAKYLEVRGKSAMDFLIKNVQRLEEELEKIEQIKTLNPIKRIGKQQKKYIVTLKLQAAKKRLSLAVQNSAVKQEKPEEVNIGSVAPTMNMTANGKGAIDSLIQDMQQLEEKLEKTKQIKTFNPIKKIAQEQQIVEVTEELNAAKQRLALAAQNAEVEQKRIQNEYKRKKQTEIKNMKSLENEIATKKTDNSLEARKAATEALANAVKSLVQRNLEPPEASTT